MKKQLCVKRNMAFLSLVLAILMLVGNFGVFPMLAAEENTARAVNDYVILDADYLIERLDKKHEVSVGKANWHYVNCSLAESEFKYVRFDVMNKDGAKHNDPYVALNVNGDYSAEIYKYVTVFVKSDENAKTGVSRAGKGFQIFFETSAANGFNEKKSKTVEYAGIEGYQILTFDFSANEAWIGDINRLRLDIYSRGEFGDGDYCEISAIVLSATPQAVYDSAFEVLGNMYPAKQVLSDFTEDELVCFNGGIEHKSGVSDTSVSIKDGNVRYDIESDYNDPYAPFYYKDLMNLRGVPESERLTAEDFEYTVMRYRTSPFVNDPQMQLFIFAGENYVPFKVNGSHLSPAVRYTPTENNNWRTMIIQMNQNSKTAEGWSGDFNGFRVDWCNVDIRDDTYMEISDILFYSNGRAARAFSTALNTLTLPISTEKVGHDGSYFKPLTAKDSYALVGVEEINAGMIDSELATHSTLISKGMESVMLKVAKKSDRPYVELNLNGGYSADKYKYITLLVKASATGGPRFSIYYPNAEGEYDDYNLAMSEYQSNSDWQVLTFNFSKLSSWSGDIGTLKLEFLYSGMSYGVGTGCRIGGMAFCEDTEAVYESAYYMLANAYSPVQVLTDFTEDDVKYFQNSENEGNTALKAENGNLIYASTGGSDPQKTFKYEAYAAAHGLKPVTTDVFQYTVMRYRAQGVNGNRLELYFMTGDAKSLWDMARFDYVDENGKRHYSIHSAVMSYRVSSAWSGVVIDMAQTDGKEDSVMLLNGWHREDGNTRFQGFRFDWAIGGAEGAFFELSDIIFFDNAEDAEAFSNAINTITIPPSFTDPIPEDSEEGGEDITEESDTDTDETTEESVPEFDNSEETTEDIPEYPVDSETESSEETESETESETAPEEIGSATDIETTEPDDGSDSEDESESSSENNGGGIGGNWDWDDEDDASSTGEGSKVPFYVACVLLACLSVASIVTVIYIKRKSKNQQ